MGTLFRRNGIWYVNYTLLGKQYRRSTKTSNRKLAEMALKDLELKIFTGQLTSASRHRQITLAQLFDEYLQHLSAQSVSDYVRHVRWHLNTWQSFLARKGVLYPENITLREIDEFFATCLSDRMPKTKKGIPG